ncbi:MAG: NAD(P)-binding protein [Cyanobacteria bacterium P01_A01_bin.137]
MKFAVVGGGLAGLMAARSLNVAYPNSDITLIERSQALGGLLAGIQYDEPDAYFDKGTHIFRETGHSEIDEFILNSIPSKELIHFEVDQGDLSGAVFEGRLQTNTHFPDIRHRADYKELVKALRYRTDSAAPIPTVKRLEPFLSNACDRFGDLYTKRVLAPILSSLYQRPAKDLASFALLLPGLTRVVGMDYADWLAISDCNQYREIFAVPDQRQLPNSFRHGKRSFYSRKQGSRRFIKGIANVLKASGVNILRGTTITALDLNQLILICLNQIGETLKLQVDGLVIATGVIGAAHLLKINLAQFDFDTPLLNRIVNLILKDPVDSNLCYFYGLDPKVDFYRVTNYRGFSDNFQDRRISIEVLGRADIDDRLLPRYLIGQLCKTAFLPNDQFSFCDTVRLDTGFPAPTVQNMQSLTRLSEYIERLLPNRVICGGIGTHQGLFFQNEILENLYKRTSQLI